MFDVEYDEMVLVKETLPLATMNRFRLLRVTSRELGMLDMFRMSQQAATDSGELDSYRSSWRLLWVSLAEDGKLDRLFLRKTLASIRGCKI